MDEPGTILGLIENRSRIVMHRGVFAGLTDAGCDVVIGASKVPAVLGTAWLPEPSEPVVVWQVDGVLMVMAPVAGKPSSGVVTAITAGIVTLTTGKGDVSCPWSGATPTVGQTMRITWHGGPVALSVSKQPDVITPATPVIPSTTRQLVFPATDSGSYNISGGWAGNWWTREVHASDSEIGAWFYGTAIKDTIPAAATINRVQMFLPWAQAVGTQPALGAHPCPVKTGAPGTSSYSGIGYAGAGWYDLGTSYGDLLKAGGPSYGMGVAQSSPGAGYHVFSSVGSDAQSGSLIITATF